MNKEEREQLFYLEAQKRVQKLRWFYVHLAAYIVVVACVIWNLLIIEDTKYTDAILAINYSTIFIWGFFIVLHIIKVYKGHSLFNKKWEEKKMKEFMGDDLKKWE
ncbi:2TM domain-containing protein [Winogradskyella sp.]|uniref:2TM domain-containing protein n=1 Tax=Winogradskyella sp. TaxID=1883156 RepID=UPI0025DDB6D9|nr:2TM domain-containing protein [Winogradskyella sp.]